MGLSHRRPLHTGLLLALMSLLLGVSLEPRPTWASAYRFAPESQYGPFIFEDSTGNLRGLSIEVLTEIINYSGLQIEVLEAAPLNKQLQALREGQADFISSLRVTPERAQYLGFSRPYVSVPAVLVLAAGDPRRGLGELHGARVAVGSEYGVESFVRAAHPQVLWVPAVDDLVALQALVHGQVQAVVADAASVSFLRQQFDFPPFELRSGLGFEYALSFAWRTELFALGDQIERGLAAIPPRRLAQIRQTWLGPETVRQMTKPLAWWVLALTLSSFGAALLIVATMRNRQAIRGGPP